MNSSGVALFHILQIDEEEIILLDQNADHTQANPLLQKPTMLFDMGRMFESVCLFVCPEQ